MTKQYLRVNSMENDKDIYFVVDEFIVIATTGSYQDANMIVNALNDTEEDQDDRTLDD